MMQRFKTIQTISSLLMVFLWAGCSAQSQADAPASPPSEAALAILAKADAADGTDDKVISKCLTCGLGMDGSADHATTFGEYELHLCSASCKKRVDADPEKAVLAAKLPASAE